MCFIRVCNGCLDWFVVWYVLCCIFFVFGCGNLLLLICSCCWWIVCSVLFCVVCVGYGFLIGVVCGLVGWYWYCLLW